jgi:hypothetical protein
MHLQRKLALHTLLLLTAEVVIITSLTICQGLGRCPFTHATFHLDTWTLRALTVSTLGPTFALMQQIVRGIM